MAPAIRRGERGPGSQAELGRGLRREIQTCLVNSDEKTLWNTGPPGGGHHWPGQGLSQRQPSAAARARGRRCRKPGGKLVPLPTWADSRPLGFPEQLRDASCQLPEGPGGRPGSGRCRALRRVPAALPPSSKCYKLASPRLPSPRCLFPSSAFPPRLQHPLYLMMPRCPPPEIPRPRVHPLPRIATHPSHQRPRSTLLSAALGVGSSDPCFSPFLSLPPTPPGES